MEMDNQALKQVFKSLHRKITKEVNPDSVIDELYSKNIINDEGYRVLRQAQSGTDRCRELFSVLLGSSHPETFIQLRLVLLDEYPRIVDEIDRQLSSLTALQPKQLHERPSIDGKFLLSVLISIDLVSRFRRALMRKLFVIYMYACMYVCIRHA